MSRTIRRKVNVKYELYRLLREHEYNSSFQRVFVRTVDINSAEGIVILNRYHSDAYPIFREPGPSWFRNMYTERTQRREAKRQLRRYLQGEDIEVILNPKNPLKYWT